MIRPLPSAPQSITTASTHIVLSDLRRCSSAESYWITATIDSEYILRIYIRLSGWAKRKLAVAIDFGELRVSETNYNEIYKISYLA